MLATYGWRRGLVGLFGVMMVLAPPSRGWSEGQNETLPRSAAAVAARAKRDAAVDKALGFFAAAKALADKQYLDDLSNAMKLAMKAGNLDEAKRIDAQRSGIDSGKGEGDAKETQPPRTIAATTARTRHDAALNKAETALRGARMIAGKQYRADLAAALREAMKVSDLEEAKRLDAARKAIDSEIAGLERPGGAGHANASYAGANALGIKFVRIEPGEFDMGSPTSEGDRQDNETLHHVKITAPFLMAATAVTQAQWRAVMGTNPSQFHGDDRPVEMVSWDDAVAFCQKLSAKEGKHYRLPTEAQWEYACRAGTQTAYAGTGKLEEMGWYQGNSDKQSHPVARKKPNAWGLYDMHGNIWQWCSDGDGPYAGDAVDPKGADNKSSRVIRGGSWDNSAKRCRAAFRLSSAPDIRSHNVGFRLCLDL
jgi:formylglycine-generating enzyme required for sulfatase activity